MHMQNQINSQGGTNPSDSSHGITLIVSKLKNVQLRLNEAEGDVQSCLSKTANLASEGADLLTPEEFSSLARHRDQLRDSFHGTKNKLDAGIHRLTAAKDLRGSFDENVQLLRDWISSTDRSITQVIDVSGDQRQTKQCKDKAKDLTDEVVSHSEDVRGLQAKSLRLQDELIGFMKEMSDSQTSIDGSSVASDVKQTMADVTREYRTLSDKCDTMNNLHSTIDEAAQRYLSILNDTKSRLNQLHNQASQDNNEDSADAADVQRQLDSVRDKNTLVLDLQTQLAQLGVAGDQYANSLQHTAQHHQMQQNINEDVLNATKQLDNTRESLLQRGNSLQTILTQSQGVKEGLQEINNWLQTVDDSFDSPKPIPLNAALLQEQMHKQQLLQSDLNSRGSALESLQDSMKQVLFSSPSHANKHISDKLTETQRRFDILQRKSSGWANGLDQAQTQLDAFNQDSHKFDTWAQAALQRITSPELDRDDVANATAEINKLREEAQAQEPLLNIVRNHAQNLLSIPHASEATKIRETARAADSKWKELKEGLRDKEKDLREKNEQFTVYKEMKAQSFDWLNNMENSYSQLSAVALDTVVLDTQLEQVQPMINDHAEFKAVIERANKHGTNYDAVMSNKKMVNQDRLMSPASISPTSSGISSFDNLHQLSTDQLTTIHKELLNINQRYEVLGRNLTDRSKEIESTRSALIEYEQERDGLQSWVDGQRDWLRVIQVPLSKSEAQERHVELTKLVGDIKARRVAYDSLKGSAHELARLKQVHSVQGLSTLTDKQKQLEGDWDSLQDECTNAQQRIQDTNTFHQSHQHMNSWLSSKERMLSVLGPVAADPVSVNNQLQQIHILNEEINSQKPQYQQLREQANGLSSTLESDSEENEFLSDKMTGINNRWDNIVDSLTKREDNLKQAQDAGSLFFHNQHNLREWLGPVAEKVDALASSNPRGGDEIDQHIAAIQGIDSVLDSKASELEGLQNACHQLTALHTDPSVQSDVLHRLNAVKQPFQELKKKLASLKGAAANAMAEGQKFDAQLDGSLSWVAEMRLKMDDLPTTSADEQKLAALQQQLQPLYDEILDREGELSLIKAKSVEMGENKNKDSAALQLSAKMSQFIHEGTSLLNDVKKKKTHVDNTAQLQEHWQRAHIQILDSLNKDKQTLDEMKDKAANDNNATDTEKRLQDIASLRLALESKASDYKSTVTVGEQLVSTADVDTEPVQDQLDSLHSLWEHMTDDAKKLKKDTDKVMKKWASFRQATNDVDSSLQHSNEMSNRSEANDAKNIGRLKAALEELQGPISSKMKNVQDAAESIGKALSPQSPQTPTSVVDVVTDLRARADSLESQLLTKLNNLEGSESLAQQLKDEAGNLAKEVKTMEETLDEMGSPARDPDNLRSQIHLTNDLIEELEKHEDAIKEAKEKLNSEHAEIVGATQEAAIGNALDKAAKDAATLKTLAKKRAHTLNELDSDITSLLKDSDDIHSQLLETMAAQILQGADGGPIGGDMKEVNLHLADVRKFKDNLEPLSNSVSDVLKRGQSLVKSAAPDVQTNYLDSEVHKLGDAWNELQSRVSDREKQLDVALLGLGNYKDSLNSLQGWLEETEDMVADLPPPAADAKVVKAQLDQQKLVQKLVDDKQPAVQGFTALSDQMEALASTDADREHFRHGSHDVNDRFQKLSSGANQRKTDLLDALECCHDWNDKHQVFSNWMNDAEKRLQALAQVPTDEQKLKELVEEHEALHLDIEDHREDMNQLMTAGETLVTLVGPKDASELDTTMSDLAQRYNRVGVKSKQLASVLDDVSQGVQRFHDDTKQLAVWLDEMQHKLVHFDHLSIYPDELSDQIEDLAILAEEITEQHPVVVAVVEEGRELCMNTTGDEAVALQGRLDGLKTRYSDLCKKADKAVVNVGEANELSQSFQESQQQLTEWLNAIETDLSRLDEASLDQQHVLVRNMEEDITAFRPVLEQMNVCGTRLGQLSNPEGASALDGVCQRLNRRVDNVCEQVQRRAERLSMAKQRSNDVMVEMDDLIGWFREAETRLASAGAASADPETTQQLLKDQKLMNEDIQQQKAKSRQLQTASKKILDEFSAAGEDSQAMHDSVDVLKELCNLCSEMSAERVNLLEQALPLAVNLHEDLNQLHDGLAQMETELDNAPAVVPGAQPESLRKQQEHNKSLVQSLLIMKPLVDKFDKTAKALAPLCNEEDAMKVQDCDDTILSRYDALKDNVKLRGTALDDALQESSQFSDKLDGMLAALGAAAEQIRSAEPVSAVPDQIRGQIEDNCALMDELEQKSAAFQAVKDAAADIMSKASPDDPAVQDIGVKMLTLDDLWDELQIGTESRGQSLTDTLAVAERFWDELNTCMNAIKRLSKQLENADPPDCEPQALQSQQLHLEDVKTELDVTAEQVDACSSAGRSLLELVGEHNTPEIEQRISELDQSWDTVTSLYHRRYDNLLEALERAMHFHDTLRDLIEWLENAEGKVEAFDPVKSMSLDQIRAQMESLDKFRDELEDKAVQREQLTQEGIQLVQGTHPEQAVAVRKPLKDLSRRWDGLNGAMNSRHRALEKALLEMGHFEQAYDQLIDWIAKSQSTLDDIQPAPGDLRQTEIELAKHKVLQNDVMAHQTSVDTLNDACRRLMSAAPDGQAPEVTQRKLDKLNDHWAKLNKDLQDKLALLQLAKSEAESFGGNISKWIGWLDEIDAILTSSKPTGGLPETAREQLDAFMSVKAEMEEYTPELEGALAAGQEYMDKADESRDTSMLAGQVDSLKKKWNEAQVKAQDRQKKLEIAMRDADEFHNKITEFSQWLAKAEQTLNAQLPVSRLLDPLAVQMNHHKEFQDDVQVHRDMATELQTRGTKLQYYCDKKDAIPIKNLLVSAKHRFDKIASRASDRTKILDNGFQEAKDFFEAYETLCAWMDESEEWLAAQTQQPGNNADKIKSLLARHKDFQHELAKRQPSYDTNLRAGKQLKDHAPKDEECDIEEYVETMRNKWNALCNGAVDRQRKLEEALLFSGQFNDAVAALIEWLTGVEPTLAADKHVMGDLDTVQGLVDQHKNLNKELKGRTTNVETVRKAAKELTANGGDSETQAAITEQMQDLEERWANVNELAHNMDDKLGKALSEAEKFHKGVYTLREWLGDMENRLNGITADSESESELAKSDEKLKNIMEEFDNRQFELDETLNIGKIIESQCHSDALQPMKTYMEFLQTRWDEVSAKAKNKQLRLREQKETRKEQDFNLDQLLAYVAEKDQQLTDAEEEPAPEELEDVQKLIEEHAQFEEELRGKQGEVDEATKGKRREEPLGNTKDAKGKKVPTRKPSKHPKAQQLSDKWRQLWLQSMERQRKLQDLLAYLREVKRLEKFAFDDWRNRYMDWMNNKKWRVMDFFRRQDKDGDGKVTRAEFVDGILASSPRRPKFPTTRLEMNKVADLFDKGDGFIDYREFIAALKPDRMPFKQEPATDSHRIKCEVVKQVDMCTCPHKYRIREVGEGKYTFGEQAKLRLVRILRSTVMVRVGGGWEALDEFLVKNDPCRANGRTNLQLREKFLLPAGVSQSMQSFKSRPSAHSSVASSSSGSHANTPKSGPITKIRQKTSRSVPMHLTSTPRRSMLTGGSRNITSLNSTADSEVSSILSTDHLLSPASRLPRGRSTASGSRPSSRGVDDRPPSRAGSDISEASSIQSRDSLGHSRIPSLRGRKGQRFSLRPSNTTPR